MNSSNRAAFTLVELLVVIAIIAVLIAMMLPGVQASRETARRAECLHNMSHVMVALQHYQQAHEMYPLGVVDDHGPIHSVAQGKHLGWIIPALPYMEELPTFKHIDQNQSVYADANAPVRKLQLGLLACPSDEINDRTIGISDYAGCHHDVEAPIDTDNHGVLFLNSKVRDEDISDGLSHTIFLGEKLAEPDDLGWMSGTRATLRNTGTPLNAALNPPITPNPGVNNEANNSGAAENMVDSNQQTTTQDNQPAASSEENPVADNSDKPPAASQPPVNPQAASVTPADPTLVVGGFTSRHPSGLNIAFGDGRVQFLVDTINQQVLQQLANRSDGQLLDASSWLGR